MVWLVGLVLPLRLPETLLPLLLLLLGLPLAVPGEELLVV